MQYLNSSTQAILNFENQVFENLTNELKCFKNQLLLIDEEIDMLTCQYKKITHEMNLIFLKSISIIMLKSYYKYLEILLLKINEKEIEKVMIINEIEKKQIRLIEQRKKIDDLDKLSQLQKQKIINS